MKHTDIEKIHAAGLISADQRDQIIAHFSLKEEGNRFLVIIFFIGAVLIAASLVLLISAYFGLFGTMARTGFMFVVSGFFLIVFGVYLEKKRRTLMTQIHSQLQT